MKSGDMTKGNPIQLILRFAVPLFIGNIFQQIYNVLDMMIAGYNLGDGAIAAIGATSSIYALVIDFASGLNSGYGIVVSRSYGAKNQDDLKRSIATMIILDMIIAVILTILSLLFIKPFMRALNVPEGIFADAYLYISVILGGIIATILYNMFAGIMRAVGNSKIPLYFLIISCAINLGLDILFIIGFGWGIQAAAVTTVIGEGCSALFSGIYIFRKYKNILPEKHHFHLQVPILKEMISSGFAMAFMLCVVDIGSVIYQRAINGLGEILIVAHTAARRLIGIFMMPLSSIATAYSTFVGQNWGAGKKERVKQALTRVLAMEVSWGLFSAIIIFLFGDVMVRLLTDTSDTLIIKNAALSLRFHFACFPALGILFVLRTALQAMGRKVVPVMSSMFELAIKVIAGIWLIPMFGYIYVCITEPIIWVVCMLFLIFIFLVRKPFKIKGEQ